MRLLVQLGTVSLNYEYLYKHKKTKCNKKNVLVNKCMYHVLIHSS